MPASFSIRVVQGILAPKPSGAPSFTSVMPNLIEDPHGLVFEYLDQDEGEFLYEVREDPSTIGVTSSTRRVVTRSLLRASAASCVQMWSISILG